MPCPTGLQFNVANGTCDYPENAKCVYGGNPATLVPPIGKFVGLVGIQFINLYLHSNLKSM